MKNDFYIPPHKRVKSTTSNVQLQNAHEPTANRDSINSNRSPEVGFKNQSHRNIGYKSNLTDANVPVNTPNNFLHKPNAPKADQSNYDFNRAKSSLKYTEHALVRADQRNISQESIAKVLHSGERSDQEKYFSSHRDEDTLVVLRQNKQVVTVMENMRNTKYDLLRNTKTREKDLIRKATYQNNDYAMCELAELYLSGDLGPRNVQKAYDWFIKAANKKNSHAMCKISGLHESGELGVKDPQVALEWMEKAAKFGNSYALAILGQRFLAKYQAMCRSLHEVSEQEKADVLTKAMSFLQRSADKGATRAIWQMAQVYEEGLLGERNLPKAIELYSKAAKLGSPSSLTSLSDLVLKGKFSPQEFEAILEKASQLIARTSSQLAIDIGLQQIEGHLGNNPQRGLNMIEKAAQKGNEEALRVLIKCYRDGHGCQPSQERSQYWALKLKELYEKAAGQGNIEAMWSLGELFLKGSLGKIDLEQAEQAFIQTAREEDIDAAYSLGMLYIEGRLGNRNPSDGIAWIKKAIEMWSKQALAGDSDAAFAIGETYLDGDLGTKDYPKALQWLSLAANKGNINAMFSLIELHLMRKSGYKNIEITLEWIERILDQSDPLSSIKEILTFFKDLRLKDNIQEAFPWFLKKALNDSTLEELAAQQLPYTFTQKLAMFQLAEIYRSGDLGSTDYAKAAKWYSLLATKGHVTALLTLAKMFQNQYLNSIDNTEEILLVQKLVTNLKIQKITDAQDALMLGKFYKEGNFLVHNLQKAVKWYSLATQLSNSDKEYHEMSKELNAILNFKEWTTTEKSQIIQGIISLADESDELSQMKVISRILGDIYNDGILIEHNPEEARVWYEKSAKMGNSKAMYRLGNIYETGALGNIDLPKAIEWYIQSAKQDNKDAIKSLTDLHNLTNLDPVLRNTIELWQNDHISNVEKEKISKTLEFYPHTPSAMYKLGKQYQDSDSGCTEQDYLQAAYWFRKAAKKNHPEATFELAKMYESGMLGEKVHSVAIEFYKQALKCYKSILKKQEHYNNDPLIIIQSLDKIGVIYSKLGKIEKSHTYQEQVFKIRQELEISNHLDLIKSLDSIDIQESSLVDTIICQNNTTLLGDQSVT